MGVIHRFRGEEGSWDWEDVAVADYGATRPNVTVRRFISRKENSSNMELRYFELGPGATSNHESHNYEHAVLVLRGRGTIRLGEEIFPIRFGDAVFVGSGDVHQFQAAADDCLGFLCAVLDKELRVKVHGEQHLEKFA
ncbi:MAG: cupin domain-containing protein [Spirochaetia bacterium]|jgi:quercetin dioxygenase-like cupin family protein